MNYMIFNFNKIIFNPIDLNIFKLFFSALLEKAQNEYSILKDLSDKNSKIYKKRLIIRVFNLFFNRLF
jgi:hypothetical protein